MNNQGLVFSRQLPKTEKKEKTNKTITFGIASRIFVLDVLLKHFQGKNELEHAF